ncbi:MAG: undecaprenyl-diphosphate phosphatase [Solirubrobacteraceae bacterium]
MHEPITYFQAIVLGIVQGISEPFPISSLGHAVVLPHLFGWNIHQNAKYFLTFVVGVHVGTALMLILIFFKDWVKIIGGLLRSIRAREIRDGDVYARLGWLLVIGTIPAGIIGLALQKPLSTLFAAASAAAAFLIVNGVALLLFERLRTRPPRVRERERRREDPDARLSRLSWTQAFVVGTAQAAALLPGISREGFAMGGGLMSGLSNEDAARYSFLLATPIILAAGLLKLPELLGPHGAGVRGQSLVAALCAAFTTLLAVKFLLRYFKTNRLTAFGVYCIGLGVVSLIALAVS